MKKYLLEDGVALPPAAPSRAGTQPQKIAPFAGLVEAWLRKDIDLRASVINERLVAEHGFTGPLPAGQDARRAGPTADR